MPSVLDPSYAGFPGNHRGKTFDRALQLVEGAQAAGSVQTEPIYIGSGLVDCDLIIDVLEKTGTGTVAVIPEYSADEDFGTVVQDRTIVLPADEIGRGVYPIRNDKENGLPGAYMRLNFTVAADNTINMTAFLAKK